MLIVRLVVTLSILVCLVFLAYVIHGRMRQPSTRGPFVRAFVYWWIVMVGACLMYTGVDIWI